MMNTFPRWAFLALAALALSALAGCGLMNAQEQQDALAALDEMLRSGSITRAQYEALREGVLSSGVGAWWQQVLGTVVAAGAAYVGVQLRRGPVATPQERVARRS